MSIIGNGIGCWIGWCDMDKEILDIQIELNRRALEEIVKVKPNLSTINRLFAESNRLGIEGNKPKPKLPKGVFK